MACFLLVCGGAAYVVVKSCLGNMAEKIKARITSWVHAITSALTSATATTTTTNPRPSPADHEGPNDQAVEVVSKDLGHDDGDGGNQGLPTAA